MWPICKERNFLTLWITILSDIITMQWPINIHSIKKLLFKTNWVQSSSSTVVQNLQASTVEYSKNHLFYSVYYSLKPWLGEMHSVYVSPAQWLVNSVLFCQYSSFNFCILFCFSDSNSLVSVYLNPGIFWNDWGFWTFGSHNENMHTCLN